VPARFWIEKLGERIDRGTESLCQWVSD